LFTFATAAAFTLSDDNAGKLKVMSGNFAKLLKTFSRHVPEVAPTPMRLVVKSPKSAALPVVEMVM
jgi:hypothetical protein